jgi:hypothetical protein
MFQFVMDFVLGGVIGLDIRDDSSNKHRNVVDFRHHSYRGAEDIHNLKRSRVCGQRPIYC